MRPSLKDRGTLTDVAKAVGVSIASVSYAFSRPELLSTKLREKILATARSLNYPGPNPAARMLRTGFAGSIADAVFAASESLRGSGIAYAHSEKAIHSDTNRADHTQASRRDATDESASSPMAERHPKRFAARILQATCI
jgi:DNA-binding LacI/PurR family transcriptional regulator